VDQFVAIPLTNFRKCYPEIAKCSWFFSIARESNVEQAKNEVIEAMRRLRRVPRDAENDFEVISPDFLSSLWNQLTGALVVLTGAISSVGLLVAASA